MPCIAAAIHNTCSKRAYNLCKLDPPVLSTTLPATLPAMLSPAAVVRPPNLNPMVFEPLADGACGRYLKEYN
jgi:hypothetical protein